MMVLETVLCRQEEINIVMSWTQGQSVVNVSEIYSDEVMTWLSSGSRKGASASHCMDVDLKKLNQYLGNGNALLPRPECGPVAQ